MLWILWPHWWHVGVPRPGVQSIKCARPCWCAQDFSWPSLIMVHSTLAVSVCLLTTNPSPLSGFDLGSLSLSTLLWLTSEAQHIWLWCAQQEYQGSLQVFLQFALCKQLLNLLRLQTPSLSQVVSSSEGPCLCAKNFIFHSSPQWGCYRHPESFLCLFFFFHSQVCGDFLSLLEVRDLLTAFHRCSVITVEIIVDVFLIHLPEKVCSMSCFATILSRPPAFQVWIRQLILIFPHM